MLHDYNLITGIFTDRVPQQQPLIEYELIVMNSSRVCITCTFLDSSATDCVAVVHQRISQLSSSGLMNIESSHKFTRSGDTAYGCIEEVNLDQYQVGVIGGKFKMITEPAPKSETDNFFYFTQVFMILLSCSRQSKRIFYSGSHYRRYV